MGAWSADNFGNDDAADWAYGLEESDDLSLVEATIAAALSTDEEYLESPSACEAIAAAEVIARLQGNWGERTSYTETVDAWVERVRLRPSPDLVERARQALDRILGPDSELRELWEEAEESDEWARNVTELRGRLQ